jgi:hypothetical protein
VQQSSTSTQSSSLSHAVPGVVPVVDSVDSPPELEPLDVESVVSPLELDASVSAPVLPTVSTPDVEPGGSPLDPGSSVVPLVGAVVVEAVVVAVDVAIVSPNVTVDALPVDPSVSVCGTPSSEHATNINPSIKRRTMTASVPASRPAAQR